MNDRLYYTKPAEQWHDALPLGNGRIGAMIYGRPLDELISLNEDSIWSGGFRKRENPKAYDSLPEIRRLIREGHTDEAHKLCEDAFYGMNDQQRHYQPACDLHITYGKDGEVTDLSHTLDLSQGVDEVSFIAGGTAVQRKAFISYPAQVMAVRLLAGGDMTYRVTLDGRDDNYDSIEAYSDDTLIFRVTDGIAYTCAVTAVCDSGSVKVCGTGIEIECEKGTFAYLYIGIQTAYRTSDHAYRAVSDVKRAVRMGYDRLYEQHISDHSSLYDRCSLSLDSEESSLPTDERLDIIKNGGKDKGLYELYFNFSRYLMIAGSRPGTLPLNLQGIWNKDMWPAWGCKYTININTEMNYWGAEITNLSECHEPLFDHIERMREHGRVTAREMYGCRGTVCHHNTDIWGDTAPQDRWLPATLWPMGMAWLCLHIYEHFLFTQDRDFLREKIDTMTEAAEFFLDYLIENDEGYLVVSPSVSPENTYITDEGRKGTLCEGAAMDTQILRELFTAVIDSYRRVGGADEAVISRIHAAREKLPPMKIGRHGQICEWAKDYDEAEPGHRHISQLFALYPASQITPDTPELMEAARKTIERRLSYGGGHTGWSRAWIINMWARLHDGEKAAENIDALLAKSTAISLLDMHPPFQIDGNFGGGAGICETLIQSVNGIIELLPALPPEWTSGRLCGARVRGGAEVSFEWADSRPVKAQIKPVADGILRLRSDAAVTADGERKDPVDGICLIEMERGKIINIIF